MVLRLRVTRAKESVTSTGTGDLLLGGAFNGLTRTFAASGVSNSNMVELVLEDVTGQWEYGIYTYVSGSPNKFTRGTPIASSNAGAAISVVTPAWVYSDLHGESLPQSKLVGEDDTQTLAGKTFDAALILATPSQGDNTKKVASTDFVQRDKRFTAAVGWDHASSSTKTLADSDSGSFITGYNGTTSTLSLPDSLTNGCAVIVANASSGAMAINYTGSGGQLTWHKAGGASTGNRSLAAGGICGIWTQGGASASWKISGQGLS